MSTYTIVVNSIVVKTISATKQYILDNHDNDIAVLGTYPIGWIYENGAFRNPEILTPSVSNFAATKRFTDSASIPDTILHKAWFKERLLPFAADIKAARAADPILDAYFDLLAEYKVVDVAWSKTIAMLNDAETRIKTVIPASNISAAALLLPRQSTEVYRVTGG